MVDREVQEVELAYNYYLLQVVFEQVDFGKKVEKITVKLFKSQQRSAHRDRPLDFQENLVLCVYVLAQWWASAPIMNLNRRPKYNLLPYQDPAVLFI